MFERPQTGYVAHLWADRIDGAAGDVFELQDRVTENVVGAIAPAVERAEIERAKRKPTGSLDAYTLYLRGLTKLYQFANRQAIEDALRLFNNAIELDQDFATAFGRAAVCYAREGSGLDFRHRERDRGSGAACAAGG